MLIAMMKQGCEFNERKTMGSREIQFDEEAKCDICGKTGAFDFMGDFICEECLEKHEKDEEGGNEQPNDIERLRMCGDGLDVVCGDPGFRTGGAGDAQDEDRKGEYGGAAAPGEIYWPFVPPCCSGIVIHIFLKPQGFQYA